MVRLGRMRGASAGSRPERARGRPGPELVAAAVSLVLVAAYLVSPLMGGDLSAQLARADFARDHPTALIDFRWFGGVLPFGYSLWVPLVMSWLGARIVGAIAAVAASVLAARLFRLSGARRPMLGGIAAAACQASDLAEGRVAFAAGMAFGLAGLVVLVGATRAPSAPGIRGPLVLAGVAALLAGSASPVVALLLWLCAAVALLCRNIAAGTVLLVASGLPVVVISGVFADGGHQVYDRTDALRAGLVTLLCLIVVPRRHRAVRLGATLGVVLVAAAYLIPTEVGGNASRLSLLFAVPIVAAFVDWRWWRAGLAIALAVVVQTPVTLGTLTGAGSAATHAAYFRPLLQEIQSRGPLTGRVEIPELNGHWEAVYAARAVPLARGWLRQVDTELNGATFYNHLPTPSSYRAFLDRNAVTYVAVPDARLTYFGRRETALISRNLPYLRPIWHNAHWVLYAVDDAIPIVAAPATLVSYDADKITITAPANSTIQLRVRWFRFLDLASGDGCIAPGNGGVVLRTKRGGTYELASALRPHGHC